MSHNLLGLLTKKFINLLKQGEDGILDLNKAAEKLEVPFLLLLLLLIFFALEGLLFYWYNIMLNQTYTNACRCRKDGYMT